MHMTGKVSNVGGFSYWCIRLHQRSSSVHCSCQPPSLNCAIVQLQGPHLEAWLQRAESENGVKLVSISCLMLLQADAHKFSPFREQHGEVKIRGETTEPTPVQLHLAAGESDQSATSGHIFMDNLRTIMHGLPADVPIMVYEDVHAVVLKGVHLQHDVNDLSQKQLTAGAKAR